MTDKYSFAEFIKKSASLNWTYEDLIKNYENETLRKIICESKPYNLDYKMSFINHLVTDRCGILLIIWLFMFLISLLMT